MGEVLKMTLRIELAWILLEAGAMALFGATYAVHARRIRLSQSMDQVPRPLAPVVCIDRHC